MLTCTPNAPAEYIGQIKRELRDRFGEHPRATQNETTDAVLQHLNQKGYKLTDIKLILLEPGAIIGEGDR